LSFFASSQLYQETQAHANRIITLSIKIRT